MNLEERCAPWRNSKVMDGLTFVRGIRDTRENYPPIGSFVQFEIDKIGRGHLTGTGMPNAEHYNPLGVVHGGFAGTLLDLALGHVSITMLDDMSQAVTTTDLNLKYLRSMSSSTGKVHWVADVLHAGKTIIVAEASLRDSENRLCATAQSTCLVVRRRD